MIAVGRHLLGMQPFVARPSVLGRASTVPACSVRCAVAVSEERGRAVPGPSGQAVPEPSGRPVKADLSHAQLMANSELTDRLRGDLILAPLTRGGNLPFRRLCADFGAKCTMSEMAFARHLNKGTDKVELARLKMHNSEQCFGFQIATNNITEGVQAGRLAKAAGATWLDLNCGCPIYEATRRGLGSSLLRKPKKLAQLVAGISSASDLPLTVKVRTGISAEKINVHEVVAALADAGAAAVIVHGRTAEQRYKKAADWELTRQLVNLDAVKIIGNGDILTFYEARRRLQTTGCHALMAGRGALIKPWLFQEWREGRELSLDAQQRIGVYRRLVAYMKEHFGDDARGRKKAFYFLPWHFDFLCRYRHLPQEEFEAQSLEQPLIATRWTDSRSGIDDSLGPLEQLLQCSNKGAHVQIADTLWEAASDADAVDQLTKLALEHLHEWTAAEREEAREDAVAEG